MRVCRRKFQGMLIYQFSNKDVTGRNFALPLVVSVIGLWLMLLGSGAWADVLRGRVEADDELLRINRPLNGSGRGMLPGQTQSTRIARPLPAFSGQNGRGLVDATAFNSPLSGRVQQSGFGLGAVKADDFASPPARKFDLGADRGSRELLLAWERWHKQLSEAIYRRWSERAELPGRAVVRVTVTSNRQIRADIISSTGGPYFESSLLNAIDGLNGNPGLTFPAKSHRPQVSFEADYIAASNVRPGYNWIKNDFERVKEEY